jgi:hypothetical protein
MEVPNANSTYFQWLHVAWVGQALMLGPSERWNNDNLFI